LRRTIKLTARQAELVLAMFVGKEKDDHHTDDEIRELVTLMWEWQWGVGRSLLRAIGGPYGGKASTFEATEVSVNWPREADQRHSSTSAAQPGFVAIGLGANLGDEL
jgi:hypothetical protein